MDRLTTAQDARNWSRQQRLEGGKVVLVPTMGALHDGHRSLLQVAKEKGEKVVVSLFLNPIQFDNDADLDSYPQQMADDLAICEAAGVDAVYTPDRAAMYPNGFATFVDVVGKMSESLCGMARPGHFRGVCTVVSKLFHACEPDVAVFGEKDLQQCLIIGRMIADLDLGVELVIAPTIREADGLAMSSRNQRLTPADREAAAAIPAALNQVNELFLNGQRNSMKLVEAFAETVLMYPDVSVDYAQVISVSGFEEVEEAGQGCLLAVAVFVGEVRLIDHLYLGGESIAIADNED